MRPLDYKFRRLAFLQVLLGIFAFCIAEGQLILLGIVGMLAIISWLYTETGGGRGLSRQMLNIGGLCSVLLLMLEFSITGGRQPVAMVGHFTLALQLVLLFAQKGRREYLQLIALSTLQMLSASVLPGGITLIYGLLLVLYCGLALLTALTFQLKSCGDLVHDRQKRAARGHNAPAYPEPVGGPAQRWHFRFSASAISVLCIVTTASLFILTPRSPRDGLALAVSTPDSARSKTGFSNTIRLGGSAIGNGSTEPVLNLQIRRNGQNLGSEIQPWLLRGAVLDHYDPNSQSWYRSQQNNRSERVLKGGNRGITLANLQQQPLYEMRITLRQISEQNLFIPTPPQGPVAISRVRVPSQPYVQFNVEDQQLTSVSASSRVQEYQAYVPIEPEGDIRKAYREQLGDDRRYDHTHPARWLGQEPAAAGDGDEPQADAELTEDDQRPRRWRWRHNDDGEAWDLNGDESQAGEDTLPRQPSVETWSVETERVRTLARAILAAEDIPGDLAEADPATKQRAVDTLARYLRLNYTYTTENPKSDEKDPVIGFLFQNRAGHCELFASGLAALCRSLGLPARVITGFRASEYNDIGEYYIVRQQHAHAWNEVDLAGDQGWCSFDATPASELSQQNFRNDQGLFGSLRSLYDHLEFAWISSIITYDRHTQEKLLGSVGDFLSAGPDTWMQSFKTWATDNLGSIELDHLGRFLMFVVGCALIIAIASLIHTLMTRHRRMVALQLTALPRKQRRALARQLRFYITMLEILARHGWDRPHWQSPYRFARDLAEQDQLRFEPAVSLTEMFYEVRFGHRTLDDLRRKQVRAHLKRLEMTLSSEDKL